MAIDYDNYMEIYRRNQSRYRKAKEPESTPAESPEEPEDQGGTFTNAFARGVDNLQASLWGFTKAVGDFLEVDVLSRWGEDGIQRNVEEILKNPAKVESWDDVDSLADFGTYFVEAIGEQAPQLLIDIPLVLAAPASGGSTAAGIAARRAALAGIGKTAKRLLGERAYSNFRKAAPALLAANLYAQSAGETQLELEAEGVDAPGTALLAGIPKAMAEKLGLDYLVAGKSITPKWAGELPKKAIEKLGGAKIREVARATGLPVEETAKRAGMVLAAAGIGMANEGSVEALQTVLDKIAVSTQKPGYDIFSEENLREIRESAIKGALVGGTYAGGQNAIQQYADYRNLRHQQDQDELRRIIERNTSRRTPAPQPPAASTEGGGFPGLNTADRGSPTRDLSLAAALAGAPAPVIEPAAESVAPPQPQPQPQPSTVQGVPAEGGGFPGLQRFDQDAPTPEPQADIDAQARALADPASAKKAMQITHGSPMPSPGILDDSVLVVEAENGPILTFDPDLAAQVQRSGDTRTIGQVLYNNPNGKDGTDGTVVLVRDENGAIMHEELTNKQRLLDSIAYAKAVAADKGKVEISTAEAQVQDRQRRIEDEEMDLAQRAIQQLAPQLEMLPETDRAPVWERLVEDLRQRPLAERRLLLSAAADPERQDVAKQLVDNAYNSYLTPEEQAPRMSDSIETDETVLDESDLDMGQLGPEPQDTDDEPEFIEDDPRDARYPATVAPGQRSKNLVPPSATKAVPAKQSWIPESIPDGDGGERPNAFRSIEEARAHADRISGGQVSFRLPTRSNGQVAFIYDHETKQKYWQLEAVQDRTLDPEFDGARTQEEFLEDTLHQGMRKAAINRRWLDSLYRQSLKDPQIDSNLIDVLENSNITLVRGDEVIQVDASDITVAGARLLDMDNREMVTHYLAFLEGMSAIMAEGWKPVTGMVNTAPKSRAAASMDMFDPNLVIMKGALREKGYEKTVFRIRDFAPIPSQLRQLKKEIAAKQAALDELQLTAYGKRLAKARSTSLEKGAAAVESAYLQYDKLKSVAESEESVAALETLLRRITEYLDVIKHDLAKTSRALREDTPEIVKLRRELAELQEQLPYSEKLAARKNEYMDVVGAIQRYESLLAKFDKNTRPMEWAVVARLYDVTRIHGDKRRDQTGQVLDQKKLETKKGLLSELRAIRKRLGAELKEAGEAVRIESDSAIAAQETSTLDLEKGIETPEPTIMDELPENRPAELDDYTPSNLAVGKPIPTTHTRLVPNQNAIKSTRQKPKDKARTLPDGTRVVGNIDDDVAGVIGWIKSDIGLTDDFILIEATGANIEHAVSQKWLTLADAVELKNALLPKPQHNKKGGLTDVVPPSKAGALVYSVTGTPIILVPPDVGKEQQVWTIGHEIGHHVKNRSYQGLPRALKARMESAFARAKRKDARYAEPNGFDEWYSDQLALHAIKGVDSDKHFLKVAKTLRGIFQKVKVWLKEKGLSTTSSRTFSDMLDELRKNPTFQTVTNIRGDQRYYYMTFAGLSTQHQQQGAKAVEKLTRWLGDGWGKVALRPFITGDSELRLQGEYGERKADLFYWKSETAKPTNKPPYFTQLEVNAGVWRTRLEQTLKPFTEEQLRQAYDELAAENPQSQAALAIRQFLDLFYKEFIKRTMPLVKYEKNYFPRYYDTMRMEEFQEEFVEILKKHKIQKPEKVFSAIIGADGQLDFSAATGPSARLQHDRVFRNPALIKDLVDAKFLNNNPVETLESYLSNALQRGTYENLISGYRYPPGYRTLNTILREANKIGAYPAKAAKARRIETFLERQLLPVLDRTGMTIQELAESDMPEARSAKRFIQAQRDQEFYNSQPSREEFIEFELEKNMRIVQKFLDIHGLTLDGAIADGYIQVDESSGYPEYQIYDDDMAIKEIDREGLEATLVLLKAQGLMDGVDDYREAVELGIIEESRTGKIRFKDGQGNWKTFTPPEGPRNYLTLRDVERSHHILNGYMGKLGLTINPAFNRYQSLAMMATNWTTLAFSAVASIVELPLLIRQAHSKEQRKELWNSFKKVLADRDTVTQLYEGLGIVEQRTTNQILASMYGYHNAHKLARRGNDVLFRINGQQWFTNTSRLVAAHFGHQFLKHHAAKAAAGDTDSLHYLKTLGVTHRDIAHWESIGEPLLTPENQDGYDGEIIYRVTTAMHRFVDSAVMRPNRAERPVWGNDPYFALFSHLKTYAWSLQKNVFAGIWREGIRRGQTRGAGAALGYFGGVAAWFFAFAVFSNELREELMYRLGGQYRPSDAMDFDEYLGHLATNRIGVGSSMSPWFDMLTNRHHHTLAPFGFSPAIGKADSILSADSGLESMFQMTPFLSQNPGMQAQIKRWMEY